MTITNKDNTLHSRKIQSRLDELESDKEDVLGERLDRIGLLQDLLEDEDNDSEIQREGWIEELEQLRDMDDDKWLDSNWSDFNEYRMWCNLKDDFTQRQWEDGIHFINDSYFKQFAMLEVEELGVEIGEWPCNCINWAARVKAMNAMIEQAQDVVFKLQEQKRELLALEVIEEAQDGPIVKGDKVRVLELPEDDSLYSKTMQELLTGKVCVVTDITRNGNLGICVDAARLENGHYEGLPEDRWVVRREHAADVTEASSGSFEQGLAALAQAKERRG